MHTSDRDVASFNETVGVTKKLATSVLIEGVEVPIIHQWGKKNLTKYPTMKVELAKAMAALNSKLFGVTNPMKERYIGTESVIVEKYNEVYAPGIGQGAVHKLASQGYGFRQICKKIGKPVLREINISHMIKGMTDGPLNLMLNEGIDKIWDLVSESDAVNYYTNALARLGVGNSATAAAATDTALIGGSTSFVAMEATYPLTTTAQRIDFKGSFADGVAEFAWEEFTVDNGVTPNHNLQRLVTPKGTKSAGEVWTAEIQITGS